MSNELIEGPKASDIAIHFETQRLAEMGRMAEAFHKAGCFGSDVKNAYQALVKIQAGFEMGIPPMEAMNSLYIVNGHIAIWGVAMIKRLKKFGWQVSYDDKPGECVVTIKKGDEVYSEKALASDVKKTGAYSFAPKQKLRYHAISQLIRFSVPEVLDAGISYLKEDAEDFEQPAGIRYADMPSDAIVMDAEAILGEIGKAETIAELEKIADSIGKLSEEDLKIVRDAMVKKRASFECEKEPAAKIHMDMAKEEPDISVETTHNMETGEITEVKVERPHRAIDSRWNFEKITQTFAALKTRDEVVGLKEELIRIYNEGEITEAMMKHGIAAAQEKLNAIISKNAKA